MSISTGVSKAEMGSSGTTSLRRMILRWILVDWGERLYSQALNVVKLQSEERSYQRSADA